MGKLHLEEKMFFLISSLVLMCSAAKREYFVPDVRNLTWEEARSHCQVCFKELVTVTPENIKTVSQSLTSDSWVGLRKNFSSAGNSSMSWSRWADGEPLAFQNWYPGWPVFKSSSAKTYCFCNCPGTTATTATTAATTSFTNFTDSTATDTSGFTTDVTDQTATDYTGLWESNRTLRPTAAAPATPVEARCVRSPETTTNYIEDSCVAMLSFGAWVEKNCADLLPFICYEDRFIGQANVTETTSDSAVLTWLPGPGDIAHYRVEVRVDEEPKHFHTNNLTYDLVNLTAGTHYSIKVVPVKCRRDLDPQETAFYTTPNKVENLTVTSVTETSVYLSWKKPVGNVAFYLVEVQGGGRNETETAGEEVGGLTPGNMYTFTVLSGVGNESAWSEGTSITQYTKPGKVSGLSVSENTVNSLLLRWERPEGTATGFRVVAMTDSKLVEFNETVSQTDVNVTRLPEGTKITLSVTALTAGNTLEGDEVTVVNYTAPGPISKLILKTTHDSLNATWKSSAGTSFTVVLKLDGVPVSTTHDLTEPTKRFYGLKTAAYYTVVVYSFSGYIRGPAVEDSQFTGLLPPTNAKMSTADNHQITFEWSAPENIAEVSYIVRINASFWGHDWSYSVGNKTSNRFDGLKSGTKYDFEVHIEANGETSTPAVASHSTLADKREITLSIMCSSAESLLCDKSTTRDSVFKQLHGNFNELLGDNVFWKLEKQEIDSK